MSKDSIKAAPEAELTSLGLKAKGDIFALMNYCTAYSEERNEKIKRLKTYLQDNGRSKTKTKLKESADQKTEKEEITFKLG